MDSLRQVDVQIKMNPEIIVPVLILGEIQLLILYLGKRNGLFLISFAEISHILDNNTGFRKKNTYLYKETTSKSKLDNPVVCLHQNTIT